MTADRRERRQRADLEKSGMKVEGKAPREKAEREQLPRTGPRQVHDNPLPVRQTKLPARLRVVCPTSPIGPPPPPAIMPRPCTESPASKRAHSEENPPEGSLAVLVLLTSCLPFLPFLPARCHL